MGVWPFFNLFTLLSFFFLEMQDNNIDLKVDGIETRTSVIQRCKSFIEIIIEEAEGNEIILAFSHASLIINFITFIMSEINNKVCFFGI